MGSASAANPKGSLTTQFGGLPRLDQSLKNRIGCSPGVQRDRADDLITSSPERVPLFQDRLQVRDAL